MTAGHTVEGKTCWSTVLLTNLYTGGSIRRPIPVSDLHRQLIRKLPQRRDEAFQFYGDGPLIQKKLQHQRSFHPAEHGVQLLPHLGSEQLLIL